MRFYLLLTAAVIACQQCVATETASDANVDEQQIANTVEAFFSASGDRDVSRLRDAVDQGILIVERAGDKPDVHMFHSPNVTHLLPPHGNDDLDSINIDRVEAHISDTNPVVAMATFRVVVPIGDEQRKQLQSTLDNAKGIPPEQSLQIQGALNGFEMFAMLIKKDGKWKLVSLTVPK